MFARLRKWIHRNDINWLEAHGYIKRETNFDPQQEDEKEIYAESAVIQAQTCSVARHLGLGYRH